MGRFSCSEGLAVEYSKPHLNYNDQVDLLVSRGMDVPERPRAVAALKRVGYYRLSAYTYPLRQPAIEGDARRSEQFVSGARFDDALALCDFDDRIRTTLLSGLQKLEIGMRVQLGYQLGKTDPFGHTTREHLDQGRCSSPPQTISAQQAGLDAHGAWLERYEQLRTEAKQEDYVKALHREVRRQATRVGRDRVHDVRLPHGPLQSAE